MLFDIYNNLEEYSYELTLCYKNKKPICVLAEAEDIKYTAKLGDIDELSFILPSKVQDFTTHQFIDNPNYDLVKGHFLILMESPDIKKYFVIDTPKELEGDKEYKEIQCYSLETDLKKKFIRNFKGTRQLYKIEGSPETGEGILNLFEEETKWKVGYLDPLAYRDNSTGQEHNKYRTFDVAESSWWDFIKNEIETAFECIVMFDTYTKTINVYHIDTLSEDKDLYISKDNYLKSVNIEPQFGEVYTRLRVYGKDGMSINSVNPLGTDYVEDFSFYINNGYMSDGLVTALNKYNALLENKKEDFTNLLQLKLAKEEVLMNKQIELATLQSELTIILDKIDGAIQKGEDLTALNQQKADKEGQISTKQGEIDNVNTEIQGVVDQITALRDLIDKKNNFTTEELDELDEFTFETTWQNENYFIVDELYEAGKKALTKLNSPNLNFSMDIADLFDILECGNERKKIRLGNIIHVETRKDVVEQRLVEYTHEVGKSLSITCTNKEKKNDEIRHLTDSISQAISAGNTVLQKKGVWDTIEGTGDWVNGIIENGLDTALSAVLSGKNQNIRIDERGIAMSDMTNLNEQLRIINNCLAMTIDGWQSASLAITPWGIIAQKLIGKIILGTQLEIADNKGNFEIKGNLLRIIDNLNRVRVKLGEYEVGKFGLQLFDKTGQYTVLDEDGIVQSFNMQYPAEVDSTHPFTFTFYIPPTVKSVRDVKLSFRLEKFRATSKGIIGGSSSRTTSVDNGSHRHMMFKNIQTSILPDEFSKFYGFNFSKSGSSLNSSEVYLPMALDGTQLTYDLYTYSADGNHSHGMDHTHNNSIEYGIYESTYPNSIDIYVDGTFRKGTYYSDQNDIQLSEWITTPGWHSIQLTSSQLGRLNASLYVKYFISH